MEGTQPAKLRIGYLDAMRVFCTFALMILHVSATLMSEQRVNSSEWRILSIFDSATRFCVPVFFMISGALFLESKEKSSPLRLFKRNIPRLLVAYGFWSFAYALFSVAGRYLTGGLSFDGIIEQTLSGHYHMWFVKTMIGIYFVTPFLFLICQTNWSMKYYLLLAFLLNSGMKAAKLVLGDSNCVVGFIDDFDINMVLGYSFYFVLGFYLHKSKWNNTKRALAYVIAIVSIIFTCIGTIALSSTGTRNLSLYSNLLPNTMAVSIGVFVLFKQINEKLSISIRVNKTIESLSKLSFGIYLVHDFYLMVMRYLGITALAITPFIWVPALSIVGMLCCVVVCAAIKKIPVVGKWIV